MALQLEGEIGGNESKVFVLATTRHEVQPRLAAWAKAIPSPYGRAVSDAWSSEMVPLHGLFLTSFKIAGKEQLKTETPFVAFSTAEGVPTFVRFKEDAPEGAEISYEVRNAKRVPRTFALDLNGLGGVGSFEGPSDIADAMFPPLANHVAQCTDRLCKGAHVGEPLCPKATKIVEWLRAETFLQRLRYSLEAGRLARGA